MTISKRKSLTINGHTISYLDINASEEKVLFFIHGNSQCKESFYFQLIDSELRENYRLIALDLPGHGGSSCTESFYSLLGLSKLVTDFITELSLSRFILIGHSLGGHVATHALPDLGHCAGLITFGHPPLGGFPDNGATPFNMDCALLPLFSKSEWTAEEEERFYLMTHKEQNKASKEILQKALSDVDPQFRPSFSASVANGMLKNEWDILKNSFTPKMNLYSKSDCLINEKYLKGIEAFGLFDSFLEFEGLGHFPHIENPLSFNQKISPFLIKAFIQTTSRETEEPSTLIRI